ncbi:MAG TPA: ATP-binding cassette domain-containing protein [Segeticoccus sp.]|uniref:ATP-binding cassette domain-containing protein n=1 Tax=Segeticoccus sp. TaxID=2706531 RepID=UPI002D7EDC41|nr:ATP-binding cassette domain-containing protein [Segeticoccus sp.]HET8600746.1 ATP-binding cassette domain-containing protein [Segeticoccus sp.]
MTITLKDFRVSAGNRLLVEVPEMALEPGALTGLTGPSRSGKSVLCQTLVGLADPNWTVSGACTRDGEELLKAGRVHMKPGKDACWIGADPRSLLDPLQRCGRQLIDAYRASHKGASASTAEAASQAMLVELGIDDPVRRMRNYPHEISGGMAQRVVIAAALLTDARLVVLDDALVGLDATLEMQIASLVRSTALEADRVVVFASHDPLLVEHVSDVVYMFAEGCARSSGEVPDLWREYVALVSLEDLPEGIDCEQSA